MKISAEEYNVIFEMPGDKQLANMMLHAYELYESLREFDEHLRTIHKYKDEKIVSNHDMAWDLREKLREIMEANQVNLEMID